MKAFTRGVDETGLTPNKSQSWYYTDSQTNSSPHFADDCLSTRRRYLSGRVESERTGGKSAVKGQAERSLGNIEKRMGARFRGQLSSDRKRSSGCYGARLS